MTTLRLSALKYCRLAAVAAVLACAFPAGAEPSGDPLSLVRRGGSAANANLANAQFVNPAFAGDSSAPFLGYRLLRYEGRDSSDHLAALTIAGFTLSYLRVADLYDPATRDFTGAHMNIARSPRGFSSATSSVWAGPTRSAPGPARGTIGIARLRRGRCCGRRVSSRSLTRSAM